MNEVKRYDAHTSFDDFKASWHEKNDGPMVKYSDYEQLKQQLDAVVAERDALAAENCIQDCIITAVKDLVHDSEGVIGWHLNGDIAPWDEVLPELSHSETPATSAALAEVEAKAIEKFAARQEEKSSAAERAWASHLGSAHQFAALQARAFAVELREGR